MRRTTVLMALLSIVFAAHAVAQDPGDTSVSVLVNDPTWTSGGSSGTSVSAGLSFGLMYRFSPRWSAEVRVGRDERTFGVGWDETQNPDGSLGLIALRQTTITYPIDVMANYNFASAGRWKPYLSMGAHYIDGPLVREAGSVLNRTELVPAVGAGTLMRITPRLALRFDGRVILRNDNPVYDRNVKAGVGLSWNF